MPKIKDLQDKLVELKCGADTLLELAAGESRELTEEEASTVDGFLADFDSTEKQLARHQKVADLEARGRVTPGRVTAPNPESTTEVGLTIPADARVNPVRNHKTWDWRTFGEFSNAVRAASMPGGYTDPRLAARMAVPGGTTTGNETSGADGGFAVPPDYRSEINALISAEDSLVARCDQITSSSNFFTVPTDSTTPWQTTGGVLAYWEGENNSITQSKPALKTETVPLDKLTCLVPVTDELLDDASGLDSYLKRKAPEKMVFKVNLAIVQGTGVGQPTGILNSAATVSVLKETAQTADTIVMENIVKMWTRLYAPSRPKSVWLINQDIEAQLMLMEFTGTNATVPAYLPANGLAGSPYGTLLGRPVIPTQACQELGDLGDIMLVDLSQYMLLQKSTGLRADTSIHLWFDYATTAYRFIWRVGGRPWWSAAADPRDGSSTVSPFVSLAERA